MYVYSIHIERETLCLGEEEEEREGENPSMNCGCALRADGGTWTAAFSWPCIEREREGERDAFFGG